MKRLQNSLPMLLIVSFLFTASMAIAKDYIIYSIGHELPMGSADQVIRKNFYVNMGSNQGLENGTILDIFRQESVLDPYASKSRYSYKVKIGELRVIHSDTDASIATLNTFDNSADRPLIEVNAPMVGDEINVKVD